MQEPYRVIDLTDERGQLAAEILASLGHDVLLVEPPGGSASRMLPPLVARGDEGAQSLAFWGWNRGKRSIVLDVGSTRGGAELVELVAGADVVFECGAVPIDLDALRRANPALVTVSISAFGSTGPKADWPATDLTVLAAGGQLALTGDADRPPVRTTQPQAFLHAAGDAACGALTALFERGASGLGQHVDVDRAAIRAVRHAEPRPRRAVRCRAVPPHGRRALDRRHRRADAVAVPRRARDGHAAVRSGVRPVHRTR